MASAVLVGHRTGCRVAVEAAQVPDRTVGAVLRAQCQLGFALALLHEARLCGAREWSSVLADRLGFACLPRAFRHEAVQCRARQRFAILADSLAVACTFRHCC